MENVSFYFCIAKLYAKFTLPSLKIFFLSENFWFPVEPLVDKKKKKKQNWTKEWNRVLERKEKQRNREWMKKKKNKEKREEKRLWVRANEMKDEKDRGKVEKEWTKSFAFRMETRYSAR